jgi:hypothetical protein
MRNGLTIMGEVDDASREIAEKKLYTLGELMRGNQLAPRPVPTGDLPRKKYEQRLDTDNYCIRRRGLRRSERAAEAVVPSSAELGMHLLTPKPPMRVPRSKLMAPRGIENAVNAKASEITDPGGILVLVDADDDCPAELGPRLLARAQKARQDIRIAVVLANREFEAWFLAAAPSLAGKQGFPDQLLSPDNPEVPRDCKGWLTRARTSGRPYKETVDQTALASIFDIKMARDNSPSFDKFYRDVAWLLGLPCTAGG